jgi:hypothetical protein
MQTWYVLKKVTEIRGVKRARSGIKLQDQPTMELETANK